MIDAGDLTGIGTFANAGRLAALGGGSRTLGAAAFSNGATGSILQSNGRTGDLLTLGGSYTGTAGSRIVQDVDLGNPAGGAAGGDRIVISGDAGGSTTFAFAPTNGVRAHLGAPIPLFAAGGTNGLTANEGRIAELGSGFVDYFLRRNAAGNGFELVSRLNSGPAAGLTGSVGGMLASLQSTIHRPASAILQRKDGCGDGRPSFSPFIRMIAGDARTTSGSLAQLEGGGSPAMSRSRNGANFKGFQTGLDAGLCDFGAAGWNLHVGATGGVVDVSTTASATSPAPVPGLATAERTRASGKIPFVGAYGLLTSGAFSGEVGVRRDFYDLELSSHDAAGGVALLDPARS